MPKKKRNPANVIVWIVALGGFNFGFKGGVIKEGTGGTSYKDFSLVYRRVNLPKERPQVLVTNLCLVTVNQRHFVFQNFEEDVKPKLVVEAARFGISPGKMLWEGLLEFLPLHWKSLKREFAENTLS